MTIAHGFAPGKLIVAGEHAVVFGHRAIAMTVKRGTGVTLTRRLGATTTTPADARLLQAASAILGGDGWHVDIETALPVGGGMGSSAALAVALVRARADHDHRVASFAECVDEAFKVERLFHGHPSGVDHTVIAQGGSWVFRKPQHDAPPSLESIDLPAGWVVLDTESPSSTQAMVSRVRDDADRSRPILDAIGELVEELVIDLRMRPRDLVRIGAALDRNHGLLQRLRVSTPRLDEAVELAKREGAYGAKLAGAGGGGVAIALCDDPQRLVSSAERAGFRAFPAASPS